MNGVMIWATITAIMTVGVLILFWTVVVENIDNLDNWKANLSEWWAERGRK